MKRLATISLYILLALCFAALLAEIPITIFTQILTYIIIEPINCHPTGSDLFLSLHSGVCDHESIELNPIYFFRTQVSNDCFPPDSRNWTRIDEMNRAKGIDTNLVEGGQMLSTARYVNFSSTILSFILICVLSYGFIYEKLVGFMITLIGFLIGSSLVSSIWSFYLVQSSDQVRSSSWTTYFKSCEVHVNSGTAHHLHIASMIICGVITIVPFSIRILLWYSSDFKFIPLRELFRHEERAVGTTPTPQVLVGDDLDFDFCDIFPNAGQHHSLELVNVHRYRSVRSRTRNPNLRHNPNHEDRIHHLHLPLDSLSAAESYIDNSNFYEVFGEDYTPIHLAYFSSNMDHEEPTANAAKDAINTVSNTISKSSIDSQSFADAALARSAHFVGLLQPRHDDHDPGPFSSIIDDFE